MVIHAKRRSPGKRKTVSRMKEYKGTPFRLTGIEIRNVRCFERVKIGLEGPDGPKKWAVILGDNGVGKTTLLRCIALGMCDVSSASGLLREIYGDWNRKVGNKLLKGEIRLTFQTDEGPQRITTIIEPPSRSSGYSFVRQTRRHFPWDGIFACGYGSARRGFGSKDVADYATIDSVYTLFNYDEPLQNPELVLRRLRDAFAERNGSSKKARTAGEQEIKSLFDALCSILMLPKNSIRLDSRGLMLAGPWGPFQPIGGLGDGYQATFSWLTDMIGWALLYGDDRPLSELTGIVLVDEIEQHLHPRWQRQIIKLLHDYFPRIQFIVTTHTPMCVVGTTYLRDDECELIKLYRDEAGVVAKENLLPPRHQGADQVLTGFLFDLPTVRDNTMLESTATLNRLNQIKVRRKLRPEEQKRLREVRSALRLEISESESKFETAVKHSVRKVLREMRPMKDRVDNEAAGFEVIRMLREMKVNEED